MEQTLRKRLGDLLGSLEADTVKLFCPKASTFRSRLVDTRNYLTHYAPGLKEAAIEGLDLYDANQRMRLLLTILLMKEIGLGESRIREVILGNDAWKQQIDFSFSKEMQ